MPLPTGAATAAGQPTVTASGSTTSGQTGNLDMAAVTSSSPTYTNGQTNALSLTTAGALRVDGSAVSQPIATAASADSNAVAGANTLTAADSVSTTSSTNQNGQTVWTGVPTANSAVVFNVTGWSTGAFSITGTFSATVNSECTADSSAKQTAGTAQWFSCSLLIPAGGSAAVGTASAFTAPVESGLTSTVGLTAVRFRIPASSYTSGTATVTANETNNRRLAHITGASFAYPPGNVVPKDAVYVGANGGGNLTGLIQASASVPVNMSSATTTQLVALSGSTKIYVTSFDVVAGGTGNFTLEYGTGSNCGTGTTALTGAYNLTAQNGVSKGAGLGPVLIVPAGNALCAVDSAAAQMSGSVSYTQF
jgi:hypothetical protein